eukprot:c36500_g1_i1 orf=368-2536(-)
MLDGQGCLLPVRHFHREDTSLMLSSWPGRYTTCRAEASAETNPSPSPSLSPSPSPNPNLNTNPNPLHSRSVVPCPCSPTEPAQAWENHGELLNPDPSPSVVACLCSPASHVDTEHPQIWDSYGELAGEAAMPCISSECDCSSTSPSRSGQIFLLSSAQEEETDPAHTGISYGELAEVGASPCIRSELDCRSTNHSRSAEMEVNSSKIAGADESVLEIASSSFRDEEESLSMCEDQEEHGGRAKKDEGLQKWEEAEASESKENSSRSAGAVENPGMQGEFSRSSEDKEQSLGSDNVETNSEGSEDTGKNSLELANLEEDSRSLTDRSSAAHGSIFLDAKGRECKRLRTIQSDVTGKMVCNSHNDDNGNTSQQQPYLPGLDNESALRCLALVPLSDLGRLAMVGRQYRDLVKSRDILKLRRTYGMVEHLVFIYTSGPGGWTAYDANRNVWRTLPPANVNPAFDLSDRESLSAGTHVLWLGKEAYEFVYYRYDLLTNNWERGPAMVNPRCLFASASCGEFAFVAGGFGPADANGLLTLLNSAERYNSLTGEWEPLPPMSTSRHKCSGIFMDGKFYVIGGRDANHQPIMSGEEYNPATGTWRTIPDMYFAPEVPRRDMYEPSPPLVAVVNNQLYAVENSTNTLKLYNKQNNTWRNLGYLPVRADHHNGWGVAFKALGDRLFVMGDMEGIAACCWRPGPNATEPVWQLLCHRERGTSFLYNCAVMAC